MIYHKAIFEPVESRFSVKRARNRHEQDKRREEIYAKIPEVGEIEREIEQTGIRLVHLALGGSVNAEQATKQIEEHNKALIQKKAFLLNKGGYPADYMKNVFDCPKCEDHGYVEGEMCSCFRSELIKEACTRSNLAPALAACTFDRFNMSYYQDITDEDGLNPRRQIHYILDCCYQFMEHFNQPDNKNLLFYGSTGLGKTYLTAAITTQMIEKGYTVIYYTAKELFSLLTDSAFGNAPELQAEAKWVYDVDLLIIDDLGSEHITSFSAASFFDILNARMMAAKKMIVNTNLDISDISTVYSSRIFSRLTEFEILKFIGEDIRVKKSSIG